MVKGKIIIDETTWKNLNEKLYAFGLSIAGGSLAPDDGLYWIGINKGCSTTYDKKKVANLLMQRLEVNKIVIDGKLFERVA